MFTNKDYDCTSGYTFEAQKAINEIFKREIAIRGSEFKPLTDRSVISWFNPLTGQYYRKCVKSFTKWVLKYGFLERECESVSERPFFTDDSYNITVFQGLLHHLCVTH